MSKMSRRIVVDASVARAAGTSENPVSTRSRQFLQAMLTVCHKVVMTDEIGREWRRQRSRFTVTWQAAMKSRRKVVDVTVDGPQEEALVEAVLGSGLAAGQRAAVEKDCLLVSAAWVADGLVASNDRKIRRLLADLATTVPAIGKVTWVDPTAEADDPVRWLEEGARSDHSRTLASLHSAGE